MSKVMLFSISLSVILLALFIVYLLRNKEFVYKSGSWPEADSAVNQAQYLYQIKRESGVDFSSGFCLSNDLAPGWVAYINGLSGNNCQAYLEGRASHFVELDAMGNLIRVK